MTPEATRFRISLFRKFTRQTWISLADWKLAISSQRLRKPKRGESLARIGTFRLRMRRCKERQMLKIASRYPRLHHQTSVFLTRETHSRVPTTRWDRTATPKTKCLKWASQQERGLTVCQKWGWVAWKSKTMWSKCTIGFSCSNRKRNELLRELRRREARQTTSCRSAMTLFSSRNR